MMRSHRTQALALVAVMGVVALAAQVAGVGTRGAGSSSKPKTTTLATVPSGAVPDIASTKLASTSIKVQEGTVVRMASAARLTARSTAAAAAAQVVCGIRYARDSDPSWSLGDPYETVTMRRGSSRSVTIERSFEAPATDTYRMSTACHVSSPAEGARVIATGTASARTGLPAGAAAPAG